MKDRPYIYWHDLRNKRVFIAAADFDGRNEPVVDFFKTQNVVSVTTGDFDYTFTSVGRFKSWIHPSCSNHWVMRLHADNWLVTPRFGTVGNTLVFNLKMNEEKLERERKVFVELVSVPAGRFKGLLVDGGVEYQRQMERLCELKM